MNTTDVQVYSYVTDTGRRISVSMGLFGEIDKDRRVTASITVDDVERFHSTSHYNLPAGVPLGEWMGYAVICCLAKHLAGYAMWHIMQGLMHMANADDVQMLPIDDRHISELTDEKAEWWTREENLDILPYLHDKLDPLIEKAIEEYPQLRKNEENN